MIPNTTQIPNNLFNSEMRKMKDTELRIVLIVARKTLGWILDKETGMRKTEDWISRNQLVQLTGKSERSISTAIENCIKNGWIEARDKDGNILDTSEKRLGKKIFYRLGRVFLNEAKNNNITGEKISHVGETGEKISGENFSGEKISPYKNKLYTKINYIQNNIPSNEGNSDELRQDLGLNKPIKRKEVSYKMEDYKRVLDEYQRLKGIKLQGKEFDPVMRDIKTMFMSGRTADDIINFMRWAQKKVEEDGKEYIWLKNWTIRTIRLKMPEFLAGKLERSEPEEDVIIPEVAKQWLLKDN
jgi:hypothetical protein